MKFIDTKGRLFNTISILDLGAALVILLVIVGIFIFPGTSGSVAQVGGTKPIQMEVLVQGLRLENPDILRKEWEENKTTKLIIRNQPHGQVDVESVKFLPNTIAVPQPDGTVTAKPDPRPEAKFQTDWLITLAGEAKITDNGAVLGNNKVKIGTTVELEGFSYNFRGSIININLPE
ncbi:MAG: pyruvate/2-oxoglutarate dehydrogenase complex,dihydrolipoamide dehydrogenase (E3) component [Cyanobacteria bacterium SW_9_44_58]|nr:MAG: pyruvate/2-oxoglutarate dehydrogenase complex,dihydrolipoamide dehydrogenase (E3) component [Cyanobacteria bacterium SW_9_44_58]